MGEDDKIVGIEGIEYLPDHMLSVVSSAKLSTPAVRCRDRSDSAFVAYIQLLHVRGRCVSPGGA